MMPFKLKDDVVLQINGKPIAKKRPRFARVGKGVKTYSDQQTDEGRFLLWVGMQYQNQPMTGPLSVNISFYMPRPKGHYGTGRNRLNLKPSAPRHHTTKPDLDNLIKFVKDCLNGIVYEDDKQVVDISAFKLYAEKPKTIIRIKQVGKGAS